MSSSIPSPASSGWSCSIIMHEDISSWSMSPQSRSTSLSATVDELSLSSTESTTPSSSNSSSSSSSSRSSTRSASALLPRTPSPRTPSPRTPSPRTPSPRTPSPRIHSSSTPSSTTDSSPSSDTQSPIPKSEAVQHRLISRLERLDKASAQDSTKTPLCAYDKIGGFNLLLTRRRLTYHDLDDQSD